MKKVSSFVLIVLVVGIVIGFISGFGRKKVDLIMPKDIVTYDDAKSVCEGYELSDAENVKTGNKLSVSYKANPVGSGDNVDVELVYYSDEYPRASVEKLYNYNKENVIVEEELSGLGQSAFISYPSVHILDRGFYIKITAGSGSDLEQKQILKALGDTASKKLNKYLEKNNLD